MSLHVVHTEVPSTTLNADTLPITFFTSSKSVRKPIVICVHGGAWMLGNESNMYASCNFIANNLDVVAVSVSYSLTLLKISEIVRLQVCTLCSCAALMYVTRNNIQLCILACLLFSVVIILLCYFLVETEVDTRFPRHVHDIARSLHFVVNNIKNIFPEADVSRISLVGHSAGAHLVSLMMCRPQQYFPSSVSYSAVKSIILLSGVYSRLVLQRSCAAFLENHIFGSMISDNDEEMCFPLPIPPDLVLPEIYLFVAEGDFSLIEHASVMYTALQERKTPFKYTYVKNMDHLNIHRQWTHSHIGQKIITFFNRTLCF